MTETLKLVYSAAKVRLGFLIMLCALAGLAVSPESSLTSWQILVLAITVLLCSSSAGAFNQWYERDIDSKMKRTKTRPFVTGRFAASFYWPAGIVLISAFAILALAITTNLAAAFYLFLGAFCYGVVYTIWLKRRTWWNVVIGGLAGSFAVLAGAAAVDVNIAPSAIILSVVLFLWTPPHFWALAIHRKDDYAKENIPMLPVTHGVQFTKLQIILYTIIMMLVSLFPFVVMMSGVFYLFSALILGIIFLYYSIALYFDEENKLAFPTFVYSIYYIFLIFAALLIDHYLI